MGVCRGSATQKTSGFPHSLCPGVKTDWPIRNTSYLGENKTRAGFGFDDNRDDADNRVDDPW